MRASRGLKWENETYKLKRSISDTRVQFYKFIVTALAIASKGITKKFDTDPR